MLSIHKNNGLPYDAGMDEYMAMYCHPSTRGGVDFHV